MSPVSGNDDDTIEIRKKPGAHSPKRRLFLTGGLAAATAGLGAAWLLRKADYRSAFRIDTKMESWIDQDQPCVTQLSFYALDSDVLVIDFPSLLVQGLTLDRLAAFVEKAKAPHDRLLDDTALAAAIAASGATIADYYYGHDYQAADIARFFVRAADEGIRLNAQERWLYRLMRQLGWLAPGAAGAVITLTAAGDGVTAEMRSVILRHEISHGAFYTVPAYRRYTENFWASLTAADRFAFTGFLGAQGYDTTLTELMLNETQAYLVFTRDPRFFNAAAIGKTEAEVDELRQGFITHMPDFWLRPLADAALPPVPRTASVCAVRSAALGAKSSTCLCYPLRNMM